MSDVVRRIGEDPTFVVKHTFPFKASNGMMLGADAWQVSIEIPGVTNSESNAVIAYGKTREEAMIELGGVVAAAKEALQVLADLSDDPDPDPPPPPKRCSRCHALASDRVVIRGSTGRILVDEPICEDHAAMERRTGSFGMASVELLPLASGEGS